MFFRVSSSNEGRILRLVTLSLNCGSTLSRPFKKLDCSSRGLAAKLSRSKKRKVDTSIEEKYREDWNANAVMRVDG